jgi:3-hydroxyisobutyrate dehydrogenase-like beta-hydroxyacid dehydrogenase
MGSAIGRVLASGGARVVATLAGRSERTGRLARDADLELLPDLDTVVREAQLVFSVAPPGQAEAIAADLAAAAARAGTRPLVADLNAISPATARRIEQVLASGELELVDGSISGPPPRTPGTTRIYLSGRSVARVLELPFEGVTLIPVGDDVGAASAVKMSTASIYKGTVALLTQALLAARANGVVEHVLADLAEGLPGLAEGAATTIARSATKSGRYVGEMRQIAATQGDAGLTPELFEAMASVYAGLADTPLGRAAPESIGDEPLDEVLDLLTSRDDRPARGRA